MKPAASLPFGRMKWFVICHGCSSVGARSPARQRSVTATRVLLHSRSKCGDRSSSLWCQPISSSASVTVGVPPFGVVNTGVSAATPSFSFHSLKVESAESADCDCSRFGGARGRSGQRLIEVLSV